MYAPGIDIEIIQHLNLNTTIKRTAINFMGCYGAFNAMRVAHDICQADPKANVLVVCVELCTIHFQQSTSRANIICNAIFADGAAAILVQAQPKQKKYLSFKAFYCDLLPQTAQEMAWYIADHGFDMVLSSYVPQLIKSGIADFVSKLLEFDRTLSLDQIKFYAIHPGAVKILQACEHALQINKQQNRFAYQVLRDYGNMSSATILFVLKALWEDINPLDHQHNIFSCAFGPGLTIESMLLQIHQKGLM